MSDQAFASPDALNTELAKTIAHRLELGIKARGKATLVVSGGSTPRPLCSTRNSKYPLGTRDRALS